MSNVIVNKEKIDLLANAISAKSGEPLTLTLDEMVSAVDGIETGGGGITPTGNIDITSAGTTDVTNYATATVPSATINGEIIPQYGYFNVSVDSDGVVSASYSDYEVFSIVEDAGFVDENTTVGTMIYSSDSYQLSTQSATSITPTETAQTAVSAGKWTTGAVTVNAIPSNYVGSGITQRSSSDLTASGATVTAPSGYYSSNATKTITSGSATPASTISGTSATVTTGTNTITLSKSVSNTPQVSAGYISSGTAGNSSVSLTASVTTKGATNHYATTSDQTIASGTYLTGNQTIKALSQTNLSAENIKSGTTITINNGNANVWSVLGTYTGGGGGGGGLDLIQTTSIGTLSTSSTSGTDTGKSISCASSTNWDDYDLLIVDVSVDTKTNGRHTSTVSLVLLTGTSNVTTKNTYTVGSNKWNSKLGSTGTASTRQSTTAYGVYVNSASVSSSTLTMPLYYKYNNNSTGTLNGTYTARVYGVKLIDLIGG